MNPGGPNRQKIKRMVLRAKLTGISSSAIRKAMGLSDTTVGWHLAALKADGLVESSHDTGRSTKWGAPGIYAAYQSDRDRAAHQRERRRNKRECILLASQGPAVRLDASVAQRVPVSVWGLA